MNLREIRKEKKYTQVELAKKAGIERVTINRIEMGKNNNVKVGTLLKLAAALEVKVDDLLK